MKQFQIFILASILTIFCLNISTGQSFNTIYSNNYNYFQFNPATSAQYEYSQFGINAIQEWNGFEKAPKSINLYGTFIEVEEKRWALGGYADLESFGVQRKIDVGFNYTYNLVQLENTLAIGLMPSYIHHGFKDPQNIDISNSLNSFSAFAFDAGLFFSTSDPTQYSESFFYGGLSSEVTNMAFGENKENNFFTNINLLLGMRMWLGEQFFLEPRSQSTFNRIENKLLSSSLGLHLEQFDYKRFKSTFGYFMDVSYVWNNAKVDDLQFFNSSWVSLGLGPILKMGSSNNWKTSNLLRAGVYFEYRIGEIQQMSGYNIGINVNCLFFNQGM